MKRLLLLFTIAWFGALLSVAASADQQASGAKGWTMPPTAKEEKNPLPQNEATLAAGKGLFAKRCARCHGPAGKGDGPDADGDHAEHMDLTRAAGAATNPDGVVFYKVWNGRNEPRMPSFQDQMTKEQVWAVVAYAQSLRVKK